MVCPLQRDRLPVAPLGPPPRLVGRKTEDIATFQPRSVHIHGLGATFLKTKRGRITLGPKGDGLLSRCLKFGSCELGDESKKKVPCYGFKLDEQVLTWGDPGR